MKKQEVEPPQKWFQTDLAYEATWNKIYHARQAISGFHEYKGRLTFQLKEYPDSNIQVTSRGKLGIFPKGVDYKTILDKVLPFLVKADGSQAKILYEIPIHEEKQKESQCRVQSSGSGGGNKRDKEHGRACK